MTRKLMFVLALITVLALGARPALAHHGGAAFDQTKQQTLIGTVTRMDFVNPHVVVYMNVQNPDGTATEWSGWLTAPNKLQRAGWSKNTLKPGDKITLVGNQQKNGSPVLQIRKVTGPEGDLPTFEQ
jgi:Cu/Ag efflux protein CusF